VLPPLPDVLLNCNQEKPGLLMLQSALPETVMSWVPPSGIKVIVDASTVSCGSSFFAFLQENKDTAVARAINITKEYLIFIRLEIS
jgi:hypothetical protein